MKHNIAVFLIMFLAFVSVLGCSGAGNPVTPVDKGDSSIKTADKTGP